MLRRRLHRCMFALAVTVSGLAAYGAFRNRGQVPPLPPPVAATSPIVGIPSGGDIVETPHYRIHTTATRKHAAEVGNALEALHEAYAAMFAIPEATSKFVVVLYGSRAEFTRHNRSSPWAEAFYLDPACYAYFDAEARNPHHWALHEAVHQLARKGSGFRRNRWIDEGLASYFSASRRVDGRLQPGNTDPTAYPVWWLTDAATTAGMPIPLETLLAGKGGPRIDSHVNQYYLSSWSLSHFLLHRDNGRHARAYRMFLEAGGDRSAFVEHVGPIETMQSEWTSYFNSQVAAARNPHSPHGKVR